jgi:hypothetical protein
MAMFASSSTGLMLDFPEFASTPPQVVALITGVAHILFFMSLILFSRNLFMFCADRKAPSSEKTDSIPGVDKSSVPFSADQASIEVQILSNDPSRQRRKIYRPPVERYKIPRQLFAHACPIPMI